MGGSDNEVIINDAAYSSVPAGCGIVKYTDLVETNKVDPTNPSGLSGLTCTSTDTDPIASCRTITVVNTNSRIIGSVTFPEYQFSFVIEAYKGASATVK
jgi:hypothetical protein